MSTYSAHTLTSWFLDHADSALETLTIHKLLYIAQGMSLAQRGKPIFREDIQAWAYGPTVPEVYRYHRGKTVLASWFAPVTIKKEDEKLLQSAYRLGVSLTSDDIRDQDPWVSNYTKAPQARRGHITIPHTELKDWFINN